MEHHQNRFYMIGSMNKYKRTRLLYILEAALEYFFSLMLTGAYIAKVASSIGMSDSLVGILSTASTLGCTFQLFALFLSNKKPVKRWVLVSHTINQLFFSAVWLIPLFELPKTLKIVAFIVALLGGWCINHVINSPKISWFMSTVDDRKRGSFTAKKEMFSLVSGMAFTLTMSAIIDDLEAKGDLRTAFLVGGLTMVGLTVLHSLTLILSYERPAKKQELKTNAKESLKGLLKNRELRRVLIFTTTGTMTSSIAYPFFGTYQNNELGFTLSFISAITILHVIVRCLTSVFLGRYADRTSFVKMLNVAYIFGMIGFGVMIFTVPENGKWMFPIFYAVFYAAFQAGYGNGKMNLVYDTVDKNQRTGAFALYNAIGGVAGFLTTLLCSVIVTKIQENGNKIFGIPIYAQQFLSAITVLLMLVSLLYLNFVLIKKKK